jgi:hypothetical protein
MCAIVVCVVALVSFAVGGYLGYKKAELIASEAEALRKAADDLKKG